MKKKFLHLLIATILAISVFPFVTTTTGAANLTAMSDTMSRLKVSENSNHEISFVTPTGVGAGEKIKVTFSDNFASGLNGVNYLDMDLEDDTVDLTLAAAPSVATWGATVSTRTVTFVSDTGTIAGGSTVVIKIGTNATEPTTGDTQIANPSGNGSNIISIATTTAADADIDTGSLAVPIMTSDQVTVSATVDPSITSVLSASTCALGTLLASAINVCTYYNRVNTNAANGYTSTITADGNLRDGANSITNEDATAVDRGSEEYGVGTDSADASLDLPTYTTCQDGATQIAGPIDTSAKIYSNYTGPASNRDTNLCHAASITGSTKAGSYSQIVTHITTGHF